MPDSRGNLTVSEGSTALAGDGRGEAARGGRCGGNVGGDLSRVDGDGLEAVSAVRARGEPGQVAQKTLGSARKERLDTLNGNVGAICLLDVGQEVGDTVSVVAGRLQAQSFPNFGILVDDDAEGSRGDLAVLDIAGTALRDLR